MLEKQADIIIADHARKKCPAGSISWKYIQDSVKAGELRDIEEYRCTPMQVGSRKVGSGQPTKQGRTLFTAEDDRVLERWVTKAARQGLSTKGNEIYRQLEAVVGFNRGLSILIELMHRRTTGILPSHGVTVGSSTSPVDHGQTLLMNPLQHTQAAQSQLRR